MKLQDEIFAESEADNFFLRNRKAFEEDPLPKVDAAVMLCDTFGLSPRRILEVGCSNGRHLDQLRKQTGAECVGVDPSNAALESGRRFFPELELHHATADCLPFEAESFDLVFLGYFLAVVDRRNLLRVMAETDRVLADGGHMIVGEFSSPTPCRVRYHHRDDEVLFSYKQDYAQILLASGWYRQMGLLTTDCSTDRYSADADPTVAVGNALLRKDLASAYPEVSVSS